MPLFNANRQSISGLESSLPFVAVDGSESTTPIALAHCHLIITMNLLKRLGGLGLSIYLEELPVSPISSQTPK